MKNVSANGENKGVKVKETDRLTNRRREKERQRNRETEVESQNRKDGLRRGNMLTLLVKK